MVLEWALCPDNAIAGGMQRGRAAGPLAKCVCTTNNILPQFLELAACQNLNKSGCRDAALCVAVSVHFALNTHPKKSTIIGYAIRYSASN